jgi:chemotaxis family two-component system response regulator Rcp1
MEIMLIEDNQGDVMMFRRALNAVESKSRLSVYEDGNKAMEYLLNLGTNLKTIRPELVVLDLKLPGKNGLELLKFLKTDDSLKRIPVIVMTDSDSAKDISDVYDLFANCFIIKPLDSDEYMKYIEYIDSFWSAVVKLPNNSN